MLALLLYNFGQTPDHLTPKINKKCNLLWTEWVSTTVIKKTINYRFGQAQTILSATNFIENVNTCTIKIYCIQIF